MRKKRQLPNLTLEADITQILYCHPHFSVTAHPPSSLPASGTALHCWHYSKSYTQSSGESCALPTHPGNAHSPGKPCRPLLCPSHSLCRSCPRRGGNHWAWCTGSPPGSTGHTSCHRTWPPPWRLPPLQVPCILLSHTKKPNSGKGHIKTRLRFIIFHSLYQVAWCKSRNQASVNTEVPTVL